MRDVSTQRISAVFATLGMMLANAAAPAASAEPAPPETASPQPATAIVSGTVVEFSSNHGLAGVPIAIARYADSSGSYTTVATSNANGSFGFVAAPGTYIVAIGSNTASDTTRATEHDVFTFTKGPNRINGPVELPAAQVALVASQVSGNFRLATLTSSERDCIAGADAGRAAKNLPLLVYDQEALELSRAFLAEELGQHSDEPRPLFDNQSTFAATGEDSYDAGSGFATCSAFTNGFTFDATNPPYEAATSPETVWFAASFGKNGSTYVNEIFGSDPKNDPPSTSIRVR